MNLEEEYLYFLQSFPELEFFLKNIQYLNALKELLNGANTIENLCKTYDLDTLILEEKFNSLRKKRFLDLIVLQHEKRYFLTPLAQRFFEIYFSLKGR
ncbi:MAG: hypothetical protein QW735_01600 [archaeon]